MSDASDRVRDALAQLTEKAKNHVAKRAEAANAASEFASAQQEVDAALEAVKAEMKATVDGTHPEAPAACTARDVPVQ